LYGKSLTLKALRFRVSVICPHCHFDPVLYVKNPAQAESKVKVKLKKHQNSAIFLFSQKNPYLRLKKIRRKEQQSDEKEPIVFPVSISTDNLNSSEAPQV